MPDPLIELYVLDEPFELEVLASGNALASVACGGTASTASCPATTASSASCFSTYT